MIRVPIASSASRVRTRAFTLIEAITTIIVVAIVSTISASLVRTAMDSYTSATTSADLSDQLSLAMDRITTELRTMDHTGAVGSVQPDITALTSSAITFRSGGATRSISLSGSNLLFTGSVTSSATLAQNVTAFSIVGYDKSNSVLPASPSAAQIATIRRLQITLSASSHGITETLRTKVFIRGLASGSGAP